MKLSALANLVLHSLGDQVVLSWRGVLPGVSELSVRSSPIFLDDIDEDEGSVASEAS